MPLGTQGLNDLQCGKKCGVARNDVRCCGHGHWMRRSAARDRDRIVTWVAGYERRRENAAFLLRWLGLPLSLNLLVWQTD